jgi:hypothetical protein
LSASVDGYTVGVASPGELGDGIGTFSPARPVGPGCQEGAADGNARTGAGGGRLRAPERAARADGRWVEAAESLPRHGADGLAGEREVRRSD